MPAPQLPIDIFRSQQSIMASTISLQFGAVFHGKVMASSFERFKLRTNIGVLFLTVFGRCFLKGENVFFRSRIKFYHPTDPFTILEPHIGNVDPRILRT